MAVNLTPGLTIGKAAPILGGAIIGEERSWPKHPDDVPMATWDSGVFMTELINLGLIPGRLVIPKEHQKKAQENPEMLLNVAKPPETITEGTYRGTQLAMTKVYELLETKYACRNDSTEAILINCIATSRSWMQQTSSRPCLRL